MTSTPSSPHEFTPAGPGDARSPCPALNALANHNHLPHNGRNIGFLQLVSALRGVYGVSLPLATVLTAGGVILCGHGFKLDLDALCRHNAIEHDASMVHRDVAETGGGNLASNKPDQDLIRAIIDSSNGHNVTLENLILAKARREQQAHIDGTPGHGYSKGYLSTISHGEPVLAAELISRPGGQGIPVEWFKTWFGEERLPDEFKKHRTLGLMEMRTERAMVTEKVNALHLENATKRRDD
ncbi:hypothetical protein FRB91_002217 [Serendipita sp. 411]|nr:hypothetical protein FRB91_002217 [Serendipita sp. 411]